MRDVIKTSVNGIMFIGIVLFLMIIGGFLMLQAIDQNNILMLCIAMAIETCFILLLFGLYSLEPNKSAVLIFFGKYIGTVQQDGLRWNNPLYQKKKVSLRVRNFESSKLKVNDLNGSPIEIAIIVVWRVEDSAEAVFNVNDYESFVQIQSESALRTIASKYPYDQDDLGLRNHSDEVINDLKHQVQSGLNAAGVSILEVRISHLAYSPEVAQAMLQRQQASAIVAARAQIVEGAVGMVETALQSLKEKEIVDFTPDQKASLVSNLMVVLCSDKGTTPVVNTNDK